MAGIALIGAVCLAWSNYPSASEQRARSGPVDQADIGDVILPIGESIEVKSVRGKRSAHIRHSIDCVAYGGGFL